MNEILIGIYFGMAFFTAILFAITLLNGDGPAEIDNFWDWVISSLLWPKFLLKGLFKFLTSNWK